MSGRRASRRESQGSGLPRPRSTSRRLQQSIERWRSGRVKVVDDENSAERDALYGKLGAISPSPEDESPDAARFRAENRNLKRLQEVIAFLAAANDAATLIPEVLDLSLSVSGFTRGLLALADRPKAGSDPSYTVRVIRGITREERRTPEVRVLRKLLSQALETRQPAFEPDVRRAPCADEEPGAERLALGAAVVLPLEANGKLLGALLLDDPARGADFATTEVDLLKGYARHAALALDRCLRLRELARKREKAVLVRDELAERVARLEEELRGAAAGPAPRAADRLDDLLERTYKRAKRAFLRRYLRDAVERNDGDLERAARAAGLTVAKLVRLLDVHEIRERPAPSGVARLPRE